MHQIIDWADDNLGLRYRTGDEYIYDCPFCLAGEKLWYNEDKNAFICYRCGVKGSGFSLVMEVEEIGYSAARRLLGVGDGDYLPAPQRIDEVFAQAQQVAEAQKAEQEIPRHIEVPGLCWHGQTPPYVYAQDIADESLRMMMARGFTQEQIIEMRAGYFIAGMYENRTCLPVFVNGIFSYFQAWDHGKRFDPKLKYLNPRNDDVPLGKSHFLYNYDRWAKAEVLVVVEGVFNAWAVEQAGYAAVGAFGKSLSDDQFSMLLCHPCKTLILGHDHDAREESAKACRCFRGAGKHCLIARVPESQDWNDLSSQARQAVIGAASAPDWLLE